MHCWPRLVRTVSSIPVPCSDYWNIFDELENVAHVGFG
jgi:hypothetical protein